MGYRNSQERKRRLIKLYNETKNSYGSGAYFDDEKKRYIQYSVSNSRGRSSYLKKVSNKKVRRTRNNFSNGAYKRVFDYQYELY